MLKRRTVQAPVVEQESPILSLPGHHQKHEDPVVKPPVKQEVTPAPAGIAPAPPVSSIGRGRGRGRGRGNF